MKGTLAFLLLGMAIMVLIDLQADAKPMLEEFKDILTVEKKACKKSGERCNQNTFGKSECCDTFSFCILAASYRYTQCAP